MGEPEESGRSHRAPEDPWAASVPGYVSAPPPTTPRPPLGLNGFAVASLVFGICGGPLFSVIFGLIALSQIKKRGQTGRGMAIAGLVLSAVWVVAIVAGIIFFSVTGASRDDDDQVDGGGSLSVNDVRTGDCFNGVKESVRILSVDAVLCSDPHDAEVLATFELPSGPYPGEAEVERLSEQGCIARVTARVQASPKRESLELLYLYPVQSSWSESRQVNCIVSDASGAKLVGRV